MRQIGKVALKVTNRSGFDKSHRNLFTTKVGTLVPTLVDEVLPNTTIHLKQAISAKLPPLAADTFMNVQLKTEAFFVPYRLLYHGWENWLMETPLRNPAGDSYKLSCPLLRVRASTVGGPGSLADFLGIKNVASSAPNQTIDVNIFPWLAYHRIYDDWYRNSRIQAPLFVPVSNQFVGEVGPETYFSVANLPFTDCIFGSFHSGVSVPQNVFDGTGTSSASSVYGSGYFADGSYITSLRQRNNQNRKQKRQKKYQYHQKHFEEH